MHQSRPDGTPTARIRFDADEAGLFRRLLDGWLSGWRFTELPPGGARLESHGALSA